MRLQTELDACIEEIPGCVFAGLADLDSGFILAAQGKKKKHRKKGDLVAAAAAEIFMTSTVQAADKALPKPIGTAVVVDKTSLHVFKRLAGRPDQALCLIFGPSVKPDEAVEAANTRRGQVEEAGIW